MSSLSHINSSGWKLIRQLIGGIWKLLKDCCCETTPACGEWATVDLTLANIDLDAAMFVNDSGSSFAKLYGGSLVTAGKLNVTFSGVTLTPDGLGGYYGYAYVGGINDGCSGVLSYEILNSDGSSLSPQCCFSTRVAVYICCSGGTIRIALLAWIRGDEEGDSFTGFCHDVGDPETDEIWGPIVLFAAKFTKGPTDNNFTINNDITAYFTSQYIADARCYWDDCQQCVNMLPSANSSPNFLGKDGTIDVDFYP